MENIKLNNIELIMIPKKDEACIVIIIWHYQVKDVKSQA